MANLYPSIVGLGGDFVLFRPYLRGVVTSWVPGSVSTLVGLTWRVTGVFGGVTTYQQVTFIPNFFNANTNRYTPSRILIDYFYVNVPGGPLATLPLNISLIRHPVTNHMYLSLDSLGFPDLYFQDLPPSPTVWPSSN